MHTLVIKNIILFFGIHTTRVAMDNTSMSVVLASTYSKTRTPYAYYYVAATAEKKIKCTLE
jgi:hypothetical protein